MKNKRALPIKIQIEILTKALEKLEECKNYYKYPFLCPTIQQFLPPNIKYYYLQDLIPSFKRPYVEERQDFIEWLINRILNINQEGNAWWSSTDYKSRELYLKKLIRNLQKTSPK